jgi:hypothetical protein
MPPSAIASSVFVAGSSSPRRSRNSSVEAAPHRIQRPAQPADRVGEQRGGQRLTRRFGAAPQVLGDRARVALDLIAAVAPRLGDGRQQLREARQPVPRLRGKVRAAEERLALRRQEHRHRPSAVPGQ